jgi:hypothetical protein
VSHDAEKMTIDNLSIDRIAELASFLDVSATNAEDIYRKLQRTSEALFADAPETLDDDSRFTGSPSVHSSGGESGSKTSKLALTLAVEVEKVYRRELDKLATCSTTLEQWRKTESDNGKKTEIERLGWELIQLQRKYMRIIAMAEKLSASKI